VESFPPPHKPLSLSGYINFSSWETAEKIERILSYKNEIRKENTATA